MAKWNHPVPGATMSQEYGVENENYSAGYHTGVDYSVAAGTPVGSAARGTVIETGSGGAYGNYVIIRHPNGMFTLYAHLKRIGVKKGEKVNEAQQIGLSGNTGNSSGPHLHFEVRDTPEYGSDNNPLSFFGGKQVDVSKQGRDGGGGGGGRERDGGGGGKGDGKGDGKDGGGGGSGTFGYVDAFLDEHPAIKALIDQARREGWTELKLAGEIKDTKWWQNRTEAQRQWDLISAESPAQAKELIADQRDALEQVFGAAGVKISGEEMQDLAKKAAVNGWSAAEMSAAAAKRFDMTGKDASKAITGSAGTAVAAIDEMSWEWGVRVDRHTKEKWVKQMIRGELDPLTMEDRLREQAKSLFPSLAQELNTKSVRELVSPYLMIAADELGLPPDQMSTFDAKWLKPLRGQKDGQRMDIEEWTAELRTNKAYGWDTTETARKSAAQMAMDLGNMMGAFA